MFTISNVLFLVIVLAVVGYMKYSKGSHKVDKTTNTEKSNKQKNTTSSKNKKKNKAKVKKTKAKKQTSSSAKETPDKITEQTLQEDVVSDDSSDDSDDCLSARQILEKRHFKTATLGGVRRRKGNNDGSEKQPSLNLAAFVKKPLFQLGDPISARYESGSEWFPGVISKVNRDGTFHIHYDDGAIETKVHASFIRSKNDTPLSLPNEETQIELNKTEVDQVNSHMSPDEDFGSVPVDDGWEVVTSRQEKRAERKKEIEESGLPKIDPYTGEILLTKKQRENKRKREKQREIKEQLRSESQKSGLHARWGGTKNTWKVAQ